MIMDLHLFVMSCFKPWRQAGYKDYHFVRPATLFINGKYQGVLWLHEVWGDEYFKEHYGRYEGSFEVLG